MHVTMSSQQSISPGAGPLARAARRGLWALPVWATLLFVSTLSHQPNPKTNLVGWSRYVTTPDFLASHLIASILGAAIGALGLVALGAVLASRGRARAGLWVMVTGVFANVLSASVLGIAAFAQPAIGRDDLGGHTAQADLLVKTVVNGGWLNVTARPVRGTCCRAPAGTARRRSDRGRTSPRGSRPGCVPGRSRTGRRVARS